MDLRGPAVIERCMDGAALAPLSGDQKRELVLLARDAFKAVCGVSGHFDTWRHYQVKLAVERDGLTRCRNEDFLPLKAHFIGMLGRKASAGRYLARAACEPRRQALAKLEQTIRKVADVLPDAREYAAGFVQNKRKVSMDEADAATVWHAVFLLRRRAAQLRKRGAA
jgi:hypothetical protein